jgi:hypothetical protein
MCGYPRASSRYAGVTVATLAPVACHVYPPHTVTTETISYDFANTTLATGVSFPQNVAGYQALFFFPFGPPLLTVFA